MIRLTIGTNTSRTPVLVRPDEKLSDVLKKNKVDYSHAALTLNGTQIPGADATRTFNDLGIEDETESMLIAVIKADSAI